MNVCKQFEEDLSAYLDKELPLTREKEVEEHLRICQGCSKKVKELEEVWGLLDEYQTKTSSCSPVSKFYIQTLPSYLLGTKNFETSFFRSKFFSYSAMVVMGILIGILLSSFAFYDSLGFSEEPWENQEMFSHSDFEIIANLEILENYEVWKYFSHEMLVKWKKKN